MKPYTPDPKRSAAMKKVWADPAMAEKLRAGRKLGRISLSGPRPKAK